MLGAKFAAYQQKTPSPTRRYRPKYYGKERPQNKFALKNAPTVPYFTVAGRRFQGFKQYGRTFRQIVL